VSDYIANFSLFPERLLKMIQTRTIEYTDGNTVCRGFIAYDASKLQPKPCVLIAHDWTGRNDFFCDKTKELAAMGYVGFAIDIFGDGRLGQTTDEKSGLISPFLADRAALARRMLAALTAASKLPEVNDQQIAAIGYCFGGLAALDLARTGANIRGAVTFHALLMPPAVSYCATIRSKILVLHGYDDPMVPPTQVNQFAQEMTMKKADWQIHMYGHTKHAFTNPVASDSALGLCYSSLADKRSWQSATLFLGDLFEGRKTNR
jgi:dienelactone hydrolase